MKNLIFRVPNEDVLEILFSNRNKSYGAYQLRREYSKTMQKSLIFFLSGIFGLVLLSFLPGKKLEEAVVKPPGTYEPTDRKIEADKKPEPPKLAIAEAPKPKQQFKIVPPRVVENDANVQEEPPTIPANELPQHPSIGNTNRPGEEEGFESEPENPFPEGEKFVEPNTVRQPEDPPLTFADAMPTFPGGVERLMDFLSKNIVYPPLAKEAGTQGRVILQFTVGRDGRIFDAEIVRDIGSGCGKEALRVLKMMPLWTPGIQNGSPVKVRLTLPVKFALE